MRFLVVGKNYDNKCHKNIFQRYLAHIRIMSFHISIRFKLNFFSWPKWGLFFEVNCRFDNFFKIFLHSRKKLISNIKKITRKLTFLLPSILASPWLNKTLSFYAASTTSRGKFYFIYWKRLMIKIIICEHVKMRWSITHPIHNWMASRWCHSRKFLTFLRFECRSKIIKFIRKS